MKEKNYKPNKNSSNPKDSKKDGARAGANVPRPPHPPKKSKKEK